MDAPTVVNAVLSGVTAISPFLVVIALLRIANARSTRRERCQARQIVLTDAIHRELGAVAAPVVSRRGSGWLVRMAVPLDRPGTTAAIVRITERVFARENDGGDRLRILLTPAASRLTPGAPTGSSDARRGRAADALPALSYR